MQKEVKKLTLFSLKEVRQVLGALVVMVSAVFISCSAAKARHQADLESEAERLVQESIEESSRWAKWESQSAARESAEAEARAEAESRAAAGIRMSPFVVSTNNAGQEVYEKSYSSKSSGRREITVDENCEADYSLVTDMTQYDVYNSIINFCYPIFLYNQVTQEYTEHLMNTYEAATFTNGEENKLVMEFMTAPNLDYKQILKDVLARVTTTYGIEPQITSQNVDSDGGELYWEYESETIVAKGAIRTRRGVIGLAAVFCPAPTDSEDAKHKDYYMECMIHLMSLGDDTAKTLTWEAYNEQQ